MAIYLVQHGKSYAKEKDPEQGLTPDGRSESMRMAELVASHHIPVAAIIHSGKKRALETAEIFREKLGGVTRFEKADGMNPGDDVIQFAGTLDPTKNEMYVGHLPFMERLVSYLVGCPTEKVVFKFQNAGVVCVDGGPEAGAWTIRWSLMPRLA